MNYRRKYILHYPYGTPYHHWEVECSLGALQVHISESSEEGREPTGGIEIHYRSPPEYMSKNAPSTHNCSIIGGPCWHDGSSLQAVDIWIPMWKRAPNDHERMFKSIERELESRFYS